MENDAKVIHAEERKAQFETREKEKVRKKEEKKSNKRKTEEVAEEKGDSMEVEKEEQSSSSKSGNRKRQAETELEAEVDLVEMGNLMDKWVEEIESGIELEGDEEWEAWDDVKGKALPLAKVKAARQEEVTYMQDKRKLWTLRPIQEAVEKRGKHQYQ